MICTTYNERLHDLWEHQPRWEVILDDGTKVYQDDGPGLSAWERLKKYCKLNNRSISSMKIGFRDNVISLPENKDGYFFRKMARGYFGGGTSLFFLVGYIENDRTVVKKYRVPEMIMEEESYREIDIDNPSTIIKYRFPINHVLSTINNDVLDREDIVICTTHFNPSSFKNRRAVYDRWVDYLGPLKKFVKTYELVFDNENPQIPNSRVVRGTRKNNLMFQKEALINLCLKELDPKIKYFVWMDHDCVTTNNDWLQKSIEVIDKGCNVLQPFDKIYYLSRHDDVVGYIDKGYEEHKHKCPGLVWVGSREFLDSIGGLPDRNIVGGGDTVFMSALCNDFFNQVGFIDGKLLSYNKRYMSKVPKGYSYLEGSFFHLFHGNHAYRQYKTRSQILWNCDYDPEQDVCINHDGILEFCSDKPFLRQWIKEYFDNRKEDL